MSEATVCGCRVVYAGRVQGVGFRATAVTLAQEFPVYGWVRNLEFPVYGWVRNLADGRVELLAEGERDQVEAFLSAVRRYWGAAVRDEEIDWRPATGALRDFKVVR